MQVKTQKTLYGYIVSPGNNPRVIENALKKRNVWQALSAQKQLYSSCFLWRQFNYTARIYEDFQQILKSYPNRHALINHFQYNHVITTKSGLLKTLKYYYSHELAISGRICHVHDIVPTSFIIRANKEDTEYRDFIEKFNQLEKKNFNKQKVPEKHCEKNIWFIKPEADNQGKGIIISNNFKQIEAFLVSKPVNSGWIVQKAIQKPLLYYGRKFDIRVWALVTPMLEVYYYTTPYIRTSSSVYTCENMSSQIHLTNNCQQKYFSQYSKFEEGNTIPMRQTLLKYIETLQNGYGKSEEILQKMVSSIKQIIIDTFMSARKFFGKSGKRKQFQLFGYDFLVDQDFRVWLLEVNNNPYLGVPNKFIKDLLPKMVDEMMEIIIDPIFPPENYTPVQQKRFQLIHKQPANFRIYTLKAYTSPVENINRRQKSFSTHKNNGRPSMLTLRENIEIKNFRLRRQSCLGNSKKQ